MQESYIREVGPVKIICNPVEDTKRIWKTFERMIEIKKTMKLLGRDRDNMTGLYKAMWKTTDELRELENEVDRERLYGVK